MGHYIINVHNKSIIEAEGGGGGGTFTFNRFF